ncbi:MAG: hypothetical protein PHN45_01975 [Methylococcales bacterium]|nr:hypothetical protein [Methylococcales bacterium]
MSTAIARQEDRKRITKSYGTKPVAHMFILEDLEYKKHNIFMDEACRQLMLNGRHSRTFTVAMVQYLVKGVTLECRGMFDFVFLQKEVNSDVREKIWSIFGSCVDKFDDFEVIFKMITENFGTMVIALRANSYNIEDNIFWYKAGEMGQFHIGHPDVWKFHKINYKDSNEYIPSNPRVVDPIDADIVESHINFQNSCRRGAEERKLLNCDLPNTVTSDLSFGTSNALPMIIRKGFLPKSNMVVKMMSL